MNIALAILVGLAIFGLAAWSMRGIMVKSQGTYDKLNAILEKSKQAATIDELKSLWAELREVNDKECWHRSFVPKVVEIKSIIETKYEMLKSVVVLSEVLAEVKHGMGAPELYHEGFDEGFEQCLKYLNVNYTK